MVSAGSPAPQAMSSTRDPSRMAASAIMRSVTGAAQVRISGSYLPQPGATMVQLLCCFSFASALFIFSSIMACVVRLRGRDAQCLPKPQRLQTWRRDCRRSPAQRAGHPVLGDRPRAAGRDGPRPAAGCCSAIPAPAAAQENAAVETTGDTPSARPRLARPGQAGELPGAASRRLPARAGNGMGLVVHDRALGSRGRKPFGSELPLAFTHTPVFSTTPARARCFTGRSSSISSPPMRACSEGPFLL